MTRVLQLLLGLLCLFGTSLSAQTTWTGTSDENWFNAINWTAGVPANGVTAIIPAAGALNDPLLDLPTDYVIDFSIENQSLLTIHLDGYELINNGMLRNAGEIHLSGDGQFINSASIINDNDGILTLHSEFRNTNTVINGGGLIENYQLLTNSLNSTIQNNGVIHNYSLLVNQFEIVNTATIINHSCQRFIGEDASSTLNMNGGIFTNNGIVYELANATVNVTNGTGVELPELSQTATPTALCVPTLSFTIENAETTFPISVDDINDNSTADYCAIDTLYLDRYLIDCDDIGETTITLTIVDELGSAATCQTLITTEAASVSSGMICNDNVNISLNETCQQVIHPDDMLEGEYTCYSDYEILINGEPNNVVDYSMIGQTIEVSVVYTPTGNTCWGNAMVEDKLGPLPSNCDTVNLLCLQNTAPISEGGDVPDVSFTDCSDDFWVYYTDEMLAGSCDDVYSMVIIRTWTAIDAFDNESTCEQVIRSQKVDLTTATISCPPDYMTECTLTGTHDISPNTTGGLLAEINGETYELTEVNDGGCNLALGIENDTLPSCDGSLKVIRTFTLVDWCLPLGPNNPFECMQQIKVADTTAPTVSAPADITVSTQAESCLAYPVLPPASATDCSGTITWKTQFPGGQLSTNGGLLPAPGLNVGTHQIIYIATDDCNNTSSDTLSLTVIDNIPPVGVCEPVTVSLTDNGYGIVDAASVDDGSTDNCCAVSFRVRRMTDNCDTPENLLFGDDVTFCCADIGQQVTVVLEVRDCYDNVNTCMTTVMVENELDPEVYCPADVSIECTQDPNDLSLTGTATAEGNCDEMFVVTYQDSDSYECGAGYIERTFTIADPMGAVIETCTQMISIENDDPLTIDDITCPADYDIVGCSANTDPSVTGTPLISAPACSDVWVGYNDLELTDDVTGACVKIMRTWTILDECVYDENNPSAGGFFECVQVIKVYDEGAPEITCFNRTYCSFTDDCADMTLDLSVELTDDCGVENLNIVWVVDLYNDGSADSGSLATGTGMNIGNAYPLGEHRITYTVTDACNHEVTCTFYFEIEDCKKPTVVCNTGATVHINADGQVDVPISLLNTGQNTDNCTAAEDLIFAFSTDPTDTQRSYDCDDLGTHDVMFFAFDEMGLFGFCNTQINVTDPAGSCSSTLMLAGSIITTSGQQMADNPVYLNNANAMAMTDSEGHFEFQNIEYGTDYTLTPQSNNDYLNGISTWDIILITRHVLGIEFLSTPEQRIAADINNSENISTIDAFILQKAILQITDGFEDNAAWRFIDAHYEFPDPTNPWAEAFPEFMNYNNLQTNQMESDFTAIKIGDVSGNATVNGFTGEMQERNGVTFNITTPNQRLEAGQQYHIKLTSKMLSSVAGYQFTLNFDTDAIDLNSIEPNATQNLSNFGMSKVEHGAITTSWNNALQSTDALETHLFTLSVTARKTTMLHDVLNLNSRFTEAVSFTNTGEALPISLIFSDESGADVPARMLLYQNRPNPFSNETVIGFELPKAEQVQLRILSNTGQEIYQVQANYEAGYHEIMLHKELFPTARGIYFYEMSTSQQSVTKRMLLTN